MLFLRFLTRLSGLPTLLGLLLLSGNAQAMNQTMCNQGYRTYCAPPLMGPLPESGTGSQIRRERRFATTGQGRSCEAAYGNVMDQIDYKCRTYSLDCSNGRLVENRRWWSKKMSIPSGRVGFFSRRGAPPKWVNWCYLSVTFYLS